MVILLVAVNCCQFDEQRIISGGADGTLRIWNTSDGACSSILQGHTGEVVSSQLISMSTAP